MKNENNIPEQHLKNTDDICKVLDAAYSMGRTIGERLLIKLASLSGRSATLE